MRVLITNNRLDMRGGSESFVRDLARALNKLGHETIAYSSDLSHQPRMLDNDVLPVATDLDRLPVKPDIIHGQHHLDAMSAVMALPDVPAVYMFHGATWRGVAPLHPRIYKYLAVSRTLRDRLIVEASLEPGNVEVFLNGVDLEVFADVRTPPDRPCRALVYHGNQTEGTGTVAAIRDAGREYGIDVDLGGFYFGKRIESPQKLLPQYDIVFASGRSAIEALACGCAVIILGRTSCGPLVTTANVDHFRSVNFTVPVNSSPTTTAHVAAQLRAYDPADSAAVTAEIRQKSDFSASIAALVSVYQSAIDAHRRAGPADAAAECAAASRYLRAIVPLVKQVDGLLGGQWSSPQRATTFEELRAQLSLIQREIDLAQ